MPQLMPLMWMFSTFMVILLLIMIMEFFYYEMFYMFLSQDMMMSKFNKINFKW